MPKFELWESNAAESMSVVDKIVDEGVLEQLDQKLYDLEVGKKQAAYNLENSLQLGCKVN